MSVRHWNGTAVSMIVLIQVCLLEDCGRERPSDRKPMEMLSEEQELQHCLQSNSNLARRFRLSIPTEVFDNLRTDVAELLANEGKYLPNWDYPIPTNRNGDQGAPSAAPDPQELRRPVPNNSTDAGLFGGEFTKLLDELVLQWVGNQFGRYARSVRTLVGPTYSAVREKLPNFDRDAWKQLFVAVEWLVEKRIRQSYPPIALTVFLVQHKLLEVWCDPDFVGEPEDVCIVERFDISSD